MIRVSSQVYLMLRDIEISNRVPTFSSNFEFKSEYLEANFDRLLSLAQSLLETCLVRYLDLNSELGPYFSVESYVAPH